MRRSLLALLLPMLAAPGWPDLTEPAQSGARAPADAALIVGIESYGGLPPAKGAARDLLAAWTWATWSRGVPLTSVVRLDRPSSRQVDAGLDRAASLAGPDGVLWVFWSGHGARDASGRPVLLTSEARTSELTRGAVPLASLLDRLGTSRARAIVVVLDLTFASLDRDGAPLVEEPAWGPAISPPADPRVALWTAGDTVAPLHGPAGMGLLTWNVLGALRGWADGVDGARDGQVTLAEVSAWVDRATAREERAPPHVPVPGALGALVVASGRLQLEPALPDASTLGEPPIPEALPEAPVDDEAGRLADEAEALRAHVQTLADRAWSDVMSAGPAGSLELAQALGDFLSRFERVTYVLPEGEVTIMAEQAPRARSMLAHGGVLTPSVVPSATIQTPAGPLRVARHELTWRERAAATGALPTDGRDAGLPVTGISWYEAIYLCNELSERDGLVPVYTIIGRAIQADPAANGWRLPTEREWEAAAGALPWAGFSDPALACEHANLAGCEGAALRRPEAGRANERGLYDLTGNAAEWVWDAWTPHPDPKAPPPSWEGAQRVIKGGSWRADPEAARSAAREPAPPATRRDDVGLRVVRWEDQPARIRPDVVAPEDEPEEPDGPEEAE